MKKIENTFEKGIFISRWLLAPFFVGLIVGIIVLLTTFGKELWHLITHFSELNEIDTILGILALVDMTLLANLLIIIIFSGYESFVSKIDAAEHEDRPGWMGKVGFSTLKVKLISSIVAISAIDLLRTYMQIEAGEDYSIVWPKLAIHSVFVVSGLLFAIMDYLTSKSGNNH
ncbi:MAG: TIGR00645 family protein [Gammaproteobacteria bacterium]|nr:TIGR00645 family protein [Gammaproteobacteria bacterium]